MHKFQKSTAVCLAVLLLLSLLSACGQTNVPSLDSTVQTQPETKDNASENLLLGTWEVVYMKTEVASEGPIEYTKTDESEFFIIISIAADGAWEVNRDGLTERFTWKQEGNHLVVGDSAISETYEIVELTETQLLLSATPDDNSTLTMRLEKH